MPQGGQNHKFISQPQKPATSGSTGGIADILMLVSIVMMASSLAIAAGMYIYATYNASAIENAKRNISRTSERFQDVTIKDFQTLGRQLAAADNVLQNHMSVSEIFRALEKSTLKSVQYNNFSYTLNPDNTIDVKLDGTALTMNAVAWQSKILANQKHIFKNPVFSNLDLNDGKPAFSVSMQINPDVIKFQNVVLAKQSELTDAQSATEDTGSDNTSPDVQPDSNQDQTGNDSPFGI